MSVKMLVLLPGEAHIWMARVPSILPKEMANTLNAGEHERARRFRFAEDRLRYAFAHGVLRDVLSRYLNCPPGDIGFAANAYGKPFVMPASGSRPPEFNLSHAGELILIGVSGGRCIGIDVEKIRPMADLESVVESQFAPQERGFIGAVLSSRREQAFFRCWTRKEAYVKALGKGLSIPLNSFDTLAEPANFAPLRMVDLNVPEGYAGAAVLETRIDRFVYWPWR
jgi:4'-phosphopantetheinyl transferase